MSEHGPGGRGSERGADGDPFADGSLDVPNCPDCLHAMEPAASPRGAVYWSCRHCGQTRLV